MIDTTDRPLYRSRIDDLDLFELHSLSDGRTWAVQPEDGYILILAGLSKQDRRRALSEALAELAA
jgi:GTP-dependent phosphoenolpyruvate carboxykinase